VVLAAAGFVVLEGFLIVSSIANSAFQGQRRGRSPNRNIAFGLIE
jgi:hypothetical protein